MHHLKGIVLAEVHRGRPADVRVLHIALLHSFFYVDFQSLLLADFCHPGSNQLILLKIPASVSTAQKTTA